MEQKFLQIFNARFIAYQLIRVYLLIGVFCVWDVKIISVLLFYFFKAHEIWLQSTTKMKMEVEEKKIPDLQSLQTVSTESDYFPAWWSQIINQNLLLCTCIWSIRSGISMTE